MINPLNVFEQMAGNWVPHHLERWRFDVWLELNSELKIKANFYALTPKQQLLFYLSNEVNWFYDPNRKGHFVTLTGKVFEKASFVVDYEGDIHFDVGPYMQFSVEMPASAELTERLKNLATPKE